MKLDRKKELCIAKAIENKDVLYVMAQIDGIVRDQEKITAKRIFTELDSRIITINNSSSGFLGMDKKQYIKFKKRYGVI
jgi:hypothetical protein